MTDMITKQPTSMESISVTGYMSQKIMEWNRSEKYRYLGPLAARVGGFAILFFAALADVCIHSALALGKGIAVLPLKPFQKYLQCPEELELGSPLLHLIEAIEKLIKAVLLPPLCAIDPERACRKSQSKEEKKEFSDIKNENKKNEEKIIAVTPHRTPALNNPNKQHGSSGSSPFKNDKMPASPKKVTPAKKEMTPISFNEEEIVHEDAMSFKNDKPLSSPKKTTSVKELVHEDTMSPYVQPKNLLSAFKACEKQEDQPPQVKVEIPEKAEPINSRPVPDTPKRNLNQMIRRTDSKSLLVNTDDPAGFKITLKREIEGKKTWAKTLEEIPFKQYHKYIKYFVEYLDGLINEEDCSLESELTHFKLHESLMRSDIKKISEIEKFKDEKLKMMLDVYGDLYQDLDKHIKVITDRQKDLDAQFAAEAAKHIPEIPEISKAEQEKQARLQNLVLTEVAIKDSKNPKCFVFLQMLICEDTKNRLTSYEAFHNLLEKIIKEIQEGTFVKPEDEKDCLSIVQKMNGRKYLPNNMRK